MTEVQPKHVHKNGIDTRDVLGSKHESLLLDWTNRRGLEIAGAMSLWMSQGFEIWHYGLETAGWSNSQFDLRKICPTVPTFQVQMPLGSIW